MTDTPSDAERLAEAVAALRELVAAEDEWNTEGKLPEGAIARLMAQKRRAMVTVRAIVASHAEPPSAPQGDAPRACFEVGAGQICEGDEAVCGGKPCTVLTVFHDGDAQIEVREIMTVKWRQITPPPPFVIKKGDDNAG